MPLKPLITDCVSASYSLSTWRKMRVEAAPYCTSKAGITAFTKSLAFEVGEYGIRVNAIAPGLVDTELYKSTSTQAGRDFLIGNCPLSRECTPEEIAKPIGFLVSNEASWVNGETLTVSGGLYTR